MAKAKKLPSGSWRCLVYDYTDSNGKRKYKSFTCDDSSTKGKRICEKMAADYAATKTDKKKSCMKTFSHELDQYINKKKSVLSPSTIRGYECMKRKLEHDYASFCSKKVSDISSSDVQILISNLSETKSPKTVKNFHGLISATIGSYVTLDTTLPQKKQADLYIPTDEEIQKLVDATKNTDIEIPVLLAAFCMMRRGEICGLNIGEDIDGNIIHVKHSLVYGNDNKWHLKVPKTESSDRYVEAPEFVIQRIREVGYITNYIPSSITREFEKTLKKNGIHQFRFHDLRHYSASIRHALGIPDAYIMKDGGWNSDRVLKSVYRHAMSDRRKEMSDKINEHFSELCNTKCNTQKKNAE